MMYALHMMLFVVIINCRQLLVNVGVYCLFFTVGLCRTAQIGSSAVLQFCCISLEVV